MGSQATTTGQALSAAVVTQAVQILSTVVLSSQDHLSDRTMVAARAVVDGVTASGAVDVPVRLDVQRCIPPPRSI